MGDPIRLPFPPSANALFTPTKRRGVRGIKSAYSAWIHDAGVELLSQRPAKHTEPVTVTLHATPPDKRIRDLDNLIKPVMDLLVRHQVIQDDNNRFVKGVAIFEADASKPGVLVTFDEWVGR